MTSPKLAQLERKLGLHRQVPERIPVPADSSGLGAAIEQLIADRVEEALAKEREQQRRSPKVERLMQSFNTPAPVTDYKQLPPIQKTAPAKNLSAQLHRDGAGTVRWMEINGVKFEALRDGAGLLIGARQIDESPVLPMPGIPHKTEARKYNPGDPR